jgi:hypothetical protein
VSSAALTMYTVNTITILMIVNTTNAPVLVDGA